MKSLDIPIENKPYLNTTCEVPEKVPTKWLLSTVICFFVLSTVGIIAFMRYDDNRKAHHEAEVKALVTKLEECKTILESRTKESDDKALLLLESLKRIDPGLEQLKAAAKKAKN